MSESALHLQPEPYRARGLVPRSAMVIVLSGLLLLAALLYAQSLPTGETALPEDQVKRQLASKELVDSQAVGNPALIDEMAELAGKASSNAAVALPRMAASAPLPPLPAIAPPSGPIEPDLQSLRRAERQMEVHGAAALMFDETAAQSEAGTGPRPVLGPDPAIEPLPRRAALPTDAALTSAGLGAALQLASQRPVAPGPAALARAWADQLEGMPPLAAQSSRAAASPWLLMEGTVIPAVTTRALNSDLPGVMTARVSQDVYDSRSSRVLLLPKGALLVGRYNNQVDFGQERLQFAFTRLRMPDGRAFDLPGATGADATGRSGVAGEVDRHWFKTLGSAVLMGLLADRVVRPAAVPAPGLNGAGLSATGQILVDTAKTELERLRATPTTITIPEGTRIHVEVVRDLAFAEPYRGRGF